MIIALQDVKKAELDDLREAVRQQIEALATESEMAAMRAHKGARCSECGSIDTRLQTFDEPCGSSTFRICNSCGNGNPEINQNGEGQSPVASDAVGDSPTVA